MVNRTGKGCFKKGHKNVSGDTRSPEWRRKISESLKGHSAKPNSGSFTAGHETWNKGATMDAETYPDFGMRGKHHTEETKRKISEAKNEGKSAMRQLLVHRAEYKAWREAVFERDDYTCQECGKRGGRLHAHHIESVATHVELIYDVDNGRTLCIECHRKTKSYGKNKKYHEAA